MRRSKATLIIATIAAAFTQERICFEIDARGAKKLYSWNENELSEANITIRVYGLEDCKRASVLFPRRFKKPKSWFGQIGSSVYKICYK